MATVALNPIFKSISGRIGNTVFYCRGNKQCVRSYVVPGNPDTALQRETRGKFTLAVKTWQQMTPDERYVYARKARNLGMSGYNLFISFFMTGKRVLEKKYNAVFRRGTVIKNNTHQSRIHSVSLSFLLPDKINMLRLYLPEGSHSLLIHYLDQKDSIVRTEKKENIIIKDGKKTFIILKTAT